MLTRLTRGRRRNQVEGFVSLEYYVIAGVVIAIATGVAVLLNAMFNSYVA